VVSNRSPCCKNMFYVGPSVINGYLAVPLQVQEEQYLLQNTRLVNPRELSNSLAANNLPTNLPGWKPALAWGSRSPCNLVAPIAIRNLWAVRNCNLVFFLARENESVVKISFHCVLFAGARYIPQAVPDF
jgi:hypothetical protein